jgi:hypothetical protein
MDFSAPLRPKGYEGQVVVKLLTYLFGYAHNFPPSCLSIISCLAPYANF